MARFISFGKIPLFDQAVIDVKRTARFKGVDDDGKPIIDKSVQAPKITTELYEKVHGMNAAVVYTKDELWMQ